MAPSPGVLATGPSYTASILAFLLCLIGTVAVTHLLENLRNRRETKELDEFESWDVDGAANGTSANGVTDGQLEAAFASEWGPPASARREQ